MLEREQPKENSQTNGVHRIPDAIIVRVPVRDAKGFLVGSDVVRLPIPKAPPKIPGR